MTGSSVTAAEAPGELQLLDALDDDDGDDATDVEIGCATGFPQLSGALLAGALAEEDDDVEADDDDDDEEDTEDPKGFP